MGDRGGSSPFTRIGWLKFSDSDETSNLVASKVADGDVESGQAAVLFM